MSSNNNSNNGVGFFSLLCLLFIGLKLGDVIQWSWWWVLAPLWVPLVIVLVLVAIVMALGRD